VSTIYVTVPASPITKTVFTTSHGSSGNYAGAGTADLSTLTVTSLHASTQVINLMPASDKPGPYSFTEDNGTTSWMGGQTPPASAQLITSTSTITLHPVSTIVPDASQGTSDITATPHLTLSATETVTHTITETLTHFIPTVPASTRYPGYGSAGWNASLTTFLKHTTAATGSRAFKPSGQEPASKNLTSYHTAAVVTPTAYGKSPRHIKARQVGGIVVATIDGVAVSWTNGFDGSSPTISYTGPAFVPVTATAPTFTGNAGYKFPTLTLPLPDQPTFNDTINGPVSSALHTGSTSSAASKTTVAIYPWDLNPTPSVSAKISTSSIVNPWTNLQPGLNPPPSVPSGFQWIPTAFSAKILTSSIVNPWTNLQPGLNPPPSVPSGFQWIPTAFSAKILTSSIVNPWTNLQPGLNPPPSVPSGFQWIPTATSPFSSAAQTPATHPAVQTEHSRSVTSSEHTVVTTPPYRTRPSQNYTDISSTGSPAAPIETSSCGDTSAMFTVNFDDLPFFSTVSDDADVPPIFNPYRKLYWEGHFGYIPPPTDPFPPHSPPQLAVYRASNVDVDGSSDAGLELTGEVGAGPRADNNAYWIDAYSAWLGCANSGPDDCNITINGYANAGSVAAVTQTITQPPCLGLKDCSLALVAFNAGFRGLDGLQIVASVDSKAVDYYMDDLQLGWSNNSCAAQQLRSSSE